MIFCHKNLILFFLTREFNPFLCLIICNFVSRVRSDLISWLINWKANIILKTFHISFWIKLVYAYPRNRFCLVNLNAQTLFDFAPIKYKSGNKFLTKFKPIENPSITNSKVFYASIFPNYKFLGRDQILYKDDNVIVGLE